MEQRITVIRRAEPRGMHFHLITHSAEHRRLMTLRAGITIKQRAEPVLRFKDSLEYFLPRKKLCLLIRGEIKERFAQCGLLRCLASPKQEGQQRSANDSFRIHRSISFQMSGMDFHDRLQVSPR